MSYRVREFAKRSHVTVRALHHYDRLGLLKPAARTERGYRVYTDADLARLGQILTLKVLGFPLTQIKELLDGQPRALVEALRFQRRALEEKRRRLGLAVQAIEEAEHAMAGGAEPDWKMFQKIIEVVEMQNDYSWVRRYYSSEALAKIDERGKHWTPELQAKVEQDWAELGGDINAAVAAGLDPAGEAGQALAARWRVLMEGFTGVDPEVEAGLKALYGDRGSWPAERWPAPYGVEGGAFIQKALATRK